MSNAAQILIPNARLHFWADFFVEAGLEAVLTFDEFMREPEAIVASLRDLAAPLPRTLPVLSDRVAALPARRAKVVDLLLAGAAT